MLITKRTAQEIAMNAANYLFEQIQYSGKFRYQRDVSGHTIKGKYNIIRHLFCIWALADIVNDPEFMEPKDAMVKLSRALRWLEPKILIDDGAHINDKNFIKLGANAGMVLAMDNCKGFVAPSEYVFQEMIRGMDSFYSKKKEAKKLAYSKMSVILRIPEPFQSDYYPGQAALAYAKTGNLARSLGIIKQLKETRDKDKATQDHWLMQAIVEIFIRLSDNKSTHSFEDQQERIEFLKGYAAQIAESIMIHPEEYADRGTPIACRAEALVAYYRMAPSETVLGFIQVLLLSLTKFQQNDPEHPAFGGFHDNNYLYQIDHSQHALSAFYKYSTL